MNVKPSVVKNALDIAKKVMFHAHENTPKGSGAVPIPLELDRDRAGINASQLANQGFAKGGKVNRADGGEVTDRKLNPQGLYSAASEAAYNLKQDKGGVDQMLASLKGVKPDELKYSGVREKFARRPSITKHQLGHYLSQSLPEIHETQFGGTNGNAWPKYSDYIMPGGNNYRELLMHQPDDQPENFQHNHWETPNVLAHLRMQDRRTPDRKKVLHLEELQSDWGQAARQKGVRDPEAHKELLKWNDEASRLFGISHDAYKKFTQHDKNDEEGWANALLARNRADMAYRDHQQFRPQAPGVVDAPYIGKTEGWTDLGLKRALVEAARGGHHKLVWTPGQEQADRYGLENHIDELHHWRDGDHIGISAFKDDKPVIDQEYTTPDKLDALVGREMARKILNNEGIEHPELGTKHFSGLDLRAGGEGMKGFYDNIVPKRLLALAKEHDPDAKLGMHQMEPVYEGEDDDDVADWRKKEINLPGLDITPKMRESILTRGFKGYSTGGFVVGGHRVARASGGSASPHSENLPQAGELQDAGGVSGGSGVLPSPGQADGPLAGLPTKIKVGNSHIIAGPDPRIRKVAGDYMRSQGMPYNPPRAYVKVDPDRASRIAQAFDDMPHDPHHPLVKAAYGALHHETMAQYHAAKKAGLKVDFWDPHTEEDPYKASPRLATEDIRNNHHMFVFPTHHGYGSEAPSEKDIAENPMLADSGEKFGKHPAVLNDIFRAVHDYYGHAKEGVGFRADGEENAWRSHAAMFSPLARLAMTGETRGQNSWLNYGPHGEHNRNAKVEDTIFAPQKVGAIAPWVAHEGAEDMTDPKTMQALQDLFDKHTGKPKRHGFKDGGGVDVDKVREAISRLHSPFSDDPESVKSALNIAESLKTPMDGKMGTGSFYNVKQPLDAKDVSAIVGNIPGVDPLPIKKRSWDDLHREGNGGTLINLGGDRSGLGRLSHVNGKELEWPVDLHAGPAYMREPNKGQVWANNSAHATVLQNVVKRAAQKGPVYGAYSPMGPRAVDSSHNMFDALMSQMKAHNLSKKDMEDFDKEVMGGHHLPEADRESVRKVLALWPGLKNAKEASDFGRLLSGTHRSAIVKHMDKAPWMKRGFPSVGMTRVAISDPEVAGASGNMLGHRIVRLDPDAAKHDESFQHSTYTTPTRGEYFGDVPLVQRHYAMPDVIDKMLSSPTKSGQIIHPYSPDPLGRSTARKLFEEQKQQQPINDRMLESIHKGLEHQKDYDFASGGRVEHVKSCGIVDRALKTLRKN